MLSIWDRLFGSFRMREDLAEIDFGLDDYDAPERQSIRGMALTPLDRKTREGAA
jgi:hypothetical protein